MLFRSVSQSRYTQETAQEQTTETNVQPEQTTATTEQSVSADVEAKKADIERRRQEELDNNLNSVKNSPIVKWLNDPLKKEGRRSEGVSAVTVYPDKPQIEWSNTSLGNLDFKLETSEERGLWVQWKEALKNKDNVRKRELEQQIGEIVAKRILQDETNAKYNAELKALENNTQNETKQNEPQQSNVGNTQTPEIIGNLYKKTDTIRTKMVLLWPH